MRNDLKLVLAFVFVSIILTNILLFYYINIRTTTIKTNNYNQDKRYHITNNYIKQFDYEKPIKLAINSTNHLTNNFIDSNQVNYSQCSMSACFNYDKCKSNRLFKVYIYDRNDYYSYKTSDLYLKLLEMIKSSKYYTSNYYEACLFVLSLDTINRDRLGNNYINDLNNTLVASPWWNNGENHVVFNLYSGTWPNYMDSINNEFGKAILAQASISYKYYRNNFDVSFPLFHNNLESTDNKRIVDLKSKKYFLTFKGKRYLTGIGSETRNYLYHLHNDNDILLVTTCNHTSNRGLEKYDNRCDIDNQLYNNYDYDDLLYNSTFCLIPRGRRLGTYRFLESLKAGCIPVLASNGWILPFSEVLDWSRAVVWVDERLKTQIPSILRKITQKQIESMQKYSIYFYNKYFSSVKIIVNTTIEIIKERIFSHETKSFEEWNDIRQQQ